ncbi:hypothetical protein ACFMJQ_15520, partial [Acinetobacter baumannii]
LLIVISTLISEINLKNLFALFELSSLVSFVPCGLIKSELLERFRAWIDLYRNHNMNKNDLVSFKTE